MTTLLPVLFLVHPGFAADVSKVAAARVVGGAVLTWDDNRILAATDIVSGASRFRLELPTRPYGWQPLGVIGEVLVSDTTPAARTSLQGTPLAPADWRGLGRCAVETREGAALLSCIDGYALLDPATAQIVGPVFPHDQTCEHDDGGETFCGYSGPGAALLGLSGSVAVAHGEDSRPAAGERFGRTALVGVDMQGANLRWKVPTPQALGAGKHGDTCWWASAGVVTALDCGSGALRWTTAVPDVLVPREVDGGVLVWAKAEVTVLAWTTGKVVWRQPLAPGEVPAVVGGGELHEDAATGERSQPFVGRGPGRALVLAPADGALLGSIPLRENEALFALPGGFARLSDRGALALFDESAAAKGNLAFGGDSRYFTLAATADRLVVTLYKHTYVVNRRTGKTQFSLDGQYHCLGFVGGKVVLHRRPLGDGGELLIRD